MKQYEVDFIIAAITYLISVVLMNFPPFPFGVISVMFFLIAFTSVLGGVYYLIWNPELEFNKWKKDKEIGEIE